MAIAGKVIEVFGYPGYADEKYPDNSYEGEVHLTVLGGFGEAHRDLSVADAEQLVAEINEAIVRAKSDLKDADPALATAVYGEPEDARDVPLDLDLLNETDNSKENN